MKLAEATRFGAVHCRVHRRVRLSGPQQVHPHPRHPMLPACGYRTFQPRRDIGVERRSRCAGIQRQRTAVRPIRRRQPVGITSAKHWLSIPSKIVHGITQNATPRLGVTHLTAPVSLHTAPSHFSRALCKNGQGTSEEGGHTFSDWRFAL